VLGRWNQSKDDIYICYTKGNCSYLKLLHADHSYSRPQVKFRKENDTTIIEYAHSFYGDYFKINKAGNLEYYKSGVFSKEYPKTL
jgi:hypothetical protein